MAEPRITQQYLEHLRGDTARETPEARVSQQYLEHLRGDTARATPQARISQQYIEHLRGDTPIPIVRQVPSANLTLSTVAPERTANSSIAPPSADLLLSTFAPLIAGTGQPPSAELTLTTSAPEVTTTVSGVSFEIPSGHLDLISYAPEIDYGIIVPSTDLMLETFEPSATLNDTRISPPSANLRFTTSLVERGEHQIEPPSTTLLFSAFAPSVELSERIPFAADLTLSASVPHVRVLVPYTVTPGSVLKMMIILRSGTVTLPPDWNPVNNRLWLWGAGGRGSHAAEVGIFIAGGGGGGGAFDESVNVGGAPGDLWSLNVGAGSAGKTVANATWVQDADLNYLAFAHSGTNASGGFTAGGVGGSGGTTASSNSGGRGGVAGGGGGGAGAAGPHSTQGTKGGAGAAGTGGFAGIGGGGGGGGGGAVGDFQYPGVESMATSGQDAPIGVSPGGPTGGEGGNGGPGYYGTGSGEGGPVGNDGEDNTGGGASGGGQGTVFGPDTPFPGADGADWTYIQSLPTNRWMVAPFAFFTTLSGRFAELSNGTVPGGGGGGGGAGWGTLLAGGYGANGGRGGFPGGGGGGSGFDSDGLLSIAFGSGPVGGDDALGGAGGDGLIILFYEGSATELCLPCDEDVSPCGDEIEPPCDVEWPFTLLQPSHVGIHPVHANIGGGRDAAGNEEVAATAGGHWAFAYGSIRIHDRAQVLKLREIKAIIEDGGGVICLHAYEGKRAPWLIIGDTINIKASGDFLSGATAGAIVVNSGGVPLPGMFWSYNNRLYCLETVGPASGSPPVYPITLWPPVRNDIASGQPLEFARPTCRARMIDDGALDLNLVEHSTLSLGFEEDH